MYFYKAKILISLANEKMCFQNNASVLTRIVLAIAEYRINGILNEIGTHEKG